MNANTVVNAIANRQYNAAEEAIAEMLQAKVSDALVSKKEEVSQDFGSQLGEAKHDKDYDEFFNKAMKKFGISSPADLKTDEKKKEFFDYVDKNFKAKNEEVELDEKEHTGKPDSKALMNKVKSMIDGMSQEEKDELLSGAKEILKNMKTMKTEEFPGAGGAGGGGGVKPGKFRGVGTNITRAINNLIPGDKKNKRRRIIRRFFRDLIDQSPIGMGINELASVATAAVLILDPNQGQGSGQGSGTGGG